MKPIYKFFHFVENGQQYFVSNRETCNQLLILRQGFMTFCLILCNGPRYIIYVGFINYAPWFILELWKCLNYPAFYTPISVSTHDLYSSY